jgi:hypothetical protein
MVALLLALGLAGFVIFCKFFRANQNQTT